jgi:hypothetical protein
MAVLGPITYRNPMVWLAVVIGAAMALTVSAGRDPGARHEAERSADARTTIA